MLQYFESYQDILIKQPTGKCLEVLLARLQLLFYVNSKLLLQSPHLQCEVDPNQDAGTWYGLKSMLVCRSIRDPGDRSILVRLGDISVARDGCHVSATTQLDGRYGKFNINTSLGRLDCAAEPLLVYSKALFHAYTSSLVADGLTGKTGAEEAIQFLSSGLCQPWSPLSPAVLPKLQAIAQLSPKRQYYPPDLEAMKSEEWNDNLPMSSQREEFRMLIEGILATSEELTAFHTAPALAEMNLTDCPTFLRSRALSRRLLYDRRSSSSEDTEKECVEAVYFPRDRGRERSVRRINVLELVNTLRTRPAQLSSEQKLKSKFTACNDILGFMGQAETATLSDRLGIDILGNWGPLVRLCQSAENSYWLMFFFAPICYGHDVNMGVVKSLLSFYLFDELRDLRVSGWERFRSFKPNPTPDQAGLLLIVKHHQSKPPEEEGSVLANYASAKQKRVWRDAQFAFEKRAEEDCHWLVKELLKQWPNPDLEAPARSEGRLLDVDAAIQAVAPEWRRLIQNKAVSDHIDIVQHALDRRFCQHKYEQQIIDPSGELLYDYAHQNTLVDLKSLITKRFCGRTDWDIKPESSGIVSRLQSVDLCHDRGTRKFPCQTDAQSSVFEAKRCIDELSGLIACLRKTDSVVRRDYANDLNASLDAFSSLTQEKMIKNPSSISLQKFFIDEATLEVSTRLLDINRSLSHQVDGCSERRIKWLHLGQLWPNVVTSDLIPLIGSTRIGIHFGPGMREAIISLGVAITKLQRLKRLNDLASRKDDIRYSEEFQNLGHTNWDPKDWTDWLLLEIESNILIRPDQVDVALATISPASGTNSVLQMNMGQGMLDNASRAEMRSDIRRENILYYTHGGGNPCQHQKSGSSCHSKSPAPANRAAFARSTGWLVEPQVDAHSIFSTHRYLWKLSRLLRRTPSNDAEVRRHYVVSAGTWPVFQAEWNSKAFGWQD